MVKHYRNNGALGALLDEYEKALHELFSVNEDVNSQDLKRIVDIDTTDEDCRSIQTILTHVLQSGYTYAIEIKKWLGENVCYREKVFFDNTKSYKLALLDMFKYTEDLFDNYPDLVLCEYDESKKIHVRWGQAYDVEQLMQHAIVHILKHRRQIERFKILIQD